MLLLAGEDDEADVPVLREDTELRLSLRSRITDGFFRKASVDMLLLFAADAAAGGSDVDLSIIANE